MNKLILFFIFKTSLIFCAEDNQTFDWPKSPRDIKAKILENLEEISDAKIFAIAAANNADSDLVRSSLQLEMQWLIYHSEAQKFSLDNIKHIDIDANSKFVAYVKTDNIVELFDLKSKHVIASFTCSENIICLKICYNGQYICILSYGEFHVWSIEDNRYCYVCDLKSALTSKPCIKNFKTAPNSECCIIELESGSNIYNFASKQVIEFNQNMLAMSNDGKLVAYRDGVNLVVANIFDFTNLQTFKNVIPARVEFSSDNNYIYCFADNYSVFKLDIKNNLSTHITTAFSECSGIFSTPRWLILLEDGYLIFKIPLSVSRDNNNAELKRLCVGNVPLATSSNGHFFISSTDKTIELYDVKSCKMVKDFTEYDERPSDIIISPNNKYIIIKYKLTRFNKNVFIWSI